MRYDLLQQVHRQNAGKFALWFRGGLSPSRVTAAGWGNARPPFFKPALGLVAWGLVCAWSPASTISVVPVFEPISLHDTDMGGAITESGAALQADVCPRPMALTGAFPEDLIGAINTPHKLPTNNPNYQVPEVNLLRLCAVDVAADLRDDGLEVTLDISRLEIPPEVDLTARQVARLVLLAVRKTLEAYQAHQTETLKVVVRIEGATDGREPLADLATEYELPGTRTK